MNLRKLQWELLSLAVGVCLLFPSEKAKADTEPTFDQLINLRFDEVQPYYTEEELLKVDRFRFPSLYATAPAFVVQGVDYGVVTPVLQPGLDQNPVPYANLLSLTMFKVPLARSTAERPVSFEPTNIRSKNTER